MQFQTGFSTFPRLCFIPYLIAGSGCPNSSVSEIILKSNFANGFLFLHMFKQSRRKIPRCQVLAYFQIIFIIIDKNTKVTAFVLFQLDAATLFFLYRICNLGPVPKINLHIYKLAQIPKIIGFIIEYRWDFLLMWRNVAETIRTAIYNVPINILTMENFVKARTYWISNLKICKIKEKC